MKPEAPPLEARYDADEAPDEAAAPARVAGDVIGETAYSERFVLKRANLDTLADEQKEKTFEEYLWILLDMSAEPDVVKFLQQRKLLDLISFELPVIDSPRILELLMGIIGNMCCLPDIRDEVTKMKIFLKSLLEYVASDDSFLLIQVLRLVNSCLYQTSEDNLVTFLEIFETINYPKSLNFILKSSSNQELLTIAIENFSTILCYCHNYKFNATFSAQFVNSETTESLFTAISELTEREAYENERILFMTLHVMAILLQFETLEEVYPCKGPLIKLIQTVMNYCRKKIVEDNDLKVYTDLDVTAYCTMTLVKVLDLSESCGSDMFFDQTYNIWKSLTGMLKNSEKDFDSVPSDIRETIKKLEGILPDLMFVYMEKCSIDHLLIVLNSIGLDYEELHRGATDNIVKINVSKRTANHRSRLLDNSNNNNHLFPDIKSNIHISIQCKIQVYKI